MPVFSPANFRNSLVHRVTPASAQYVVVGSTSFDRHPIRVGAVDIVCTPQVQGLYVDGELEEQSPTLTIEKVLEILGVPFRSHYLSSPENPSVKRALLPSQFHKVILEDDCYNSAPPRKERLPGA